MVKRTVSVRSDLERVSVGFEAIQDRIAALSEESKGFFYPPYNIKKSGVNYVIEVDVSKYNQDTISAKLEGSSLVVSASGSDTGADTSGTYIHQGISPKGGFDAKFHVADHLEVKSAELKDGIVTFNFGIKPTSVETKIVPIKGVDETAETEPFVPVYDSSGRVQGHKKVEHEHKGETSEIVVNADTHRKPTVAVSIPDSITPIVEVTAEKLVEAVDKKDENPQVKVDVKDATEKPVTEGTVTKVLKTEEGLPDVLVQIPEKDYKEAKAEGVDLVDAVKSAMKDKGTDVKSEDTVPVAAEPVKVEEVVETPKESVVLDGDKTDKPTVEVKLPEALPQIVEAKVEKVEEKVDTASEHPQVVIDVADASLEVSDDVVVAAVKTEEGKSDVVVAVKAEDKAAADAAGVDVVEKVKEAYDASFSPAPELPAVEETKKEVKDIEGKNAAIEVPDKVPQVVEAKVSVEDKPVVKLEDVSENIPEGAELIPVVTADGQNDIVVAVTPDTKKELDASGIDVAVDVGDALVKAETEVVKTEISEPDADVVVEAVEEPKVEVSLPENVPQVVAVEDVKVEADGSVTVETKDATIEVTDTAELSVAKTEEGKSDIVVAVEPEVKAKAEEAGVDLNKAIADAVAAENSAPELPAVEEETVTVLVDKTDDHVPTVDVVVPETTTQIVEAKIDTEKSTEETPAIKLEDTSENISDTAELIPVLTPAGQPDLVVAVEPEVKEALKEFGTDLETVVEKAVNQADVVVDTITEVDPVEVKAASEVTEVAEKLEELAKEPATIVVDEASADKPTVEVTLAAEESPQIVSVEKIEAEKDDAVAISVNDATVEVSDTATLEVIATEDGKSDVVVAIEPEVKAELEEAGVDVAAVVKEALETNDAVPELPVTPTTDEAEDVAVLVDKTDEDKPTVEVTTPDTVTQVMELKSETEPTTDEVAVKLEDTSGSISETAELIPVVTPEGQPDIVVAVEPEVKDILETAGANTVEVVEKAVNQADVTVETVVTANQEAIDVASEVTEVAEKLEEIAKEPATILVNDAVEDKPTVEVTLAAEESPQIVEVKLDENPTSSDIPAIVVEDASIEVSDNVETEVIKTEDGKSDVVVAVDPLVKEVLADAGVDVVEVVKEALEVNDAVPELPEEAPAAETTEVKLDEANAEVPTVNVEVPETVSQVVEVTAPEVTSEEVTLEIKDTSEEISETAEVIPVVTPAGEPDIVAVIEPEVKAELDAVGVDVVEKVEEALEAAKPEVETVVEVDQVKVDEASAAMVEPDTQKVTLNSDTTEKPTVDVVLPEVLPQIVEVTAEAKTDSVDLASKETQVEVVVKDATYEVSDNVVTTVVKTEEGKSDVVVAIEGGLDEKLKADGLDAVEAVKEAIELTSPEVVETPKTEVTDTVELTITDDAETPKVEVEVPETITQVVEAKVVEGDGDIPKVELVDTSENINPDAEIIPVVTADGQSDAMVVVAPETKEVLDKADVDVQNEVSEALIAANVAVDVVKS